MAGSILGASVKRVEDPRFVTGAGTYLGDLQFENQVWMSVVRSTVPHAVVTSIDVEAAAAMPGVVAIYTAEDFAGLTMPTDYGGHPEPMRRPLIPADRVRFVGDIVAVVVAESPSQAADAADEVWPEYDELPAVVDPVASAGPDAPLLYPGHGSNIAKEHRLESPTDDPGPDEVVITATIRHQRLAAIPLEANSAVSIPRDDGGVDVWAGSQQAHGHRNVISSSLGIDRNLVHVKVPDMGGGFGAKIAVYPEQVLTAAIASKLGRPVRWEETRRENMLVMSHGRAQSHDMTLYASRDGKVRRVEWVVTQDAGAYPQYGAEIPYFTKRMAAGPYLIPELDFTSRSAVTNTTPTHAYRGAGRPEATLTLERLMDMLAAELGIDPAEVRRRNFIPPDAFPHVTAAGERYDTGRYETALDLALDTVGYAAVREEQRARRDRGDRLQIGIGLGSYVEITAPGGRKDWGRVVVHPDESVTIYSGASSHGHSHETTFAQLVSQVLRVPLEQISFVQADTDRIKRGGGTMGSRSMQMAGSALKRAGDTVVDKARQIVAKAAEARLEDVVQFEDGRIGVTGVPDTGRTLGEIARLATDPVNLPEGMQPGLEADDLWEQEHATVPFGTHVTVVEVDTETGDVSVLRHVACDDPGTVFSRMVVDGQVHGGVAQGIGQALFEQVLYDETGTPLTVNLTSYLIPTASVLPSIEIDRTTTPTEENPLGVKGIGEAGTIGSTPAVVNAVLDALAAHGVRDLDMPLTPSKVWGAIQSSRTAS
ncbi:MAG TPA: xanthine dehydrogenase family protein molybdopterin-binding subunit [Acidimicrobiia bacterium]|nr:xanthine dehydrogenase family protein molybdopterin-binding subunit [Acidimicrobiia bacterium]